MFFFLNSKAYQQLFERQPTRFQQNSGFLSPILAIETFFSKKNFIL